MGLVNTYRVFRGDVRKRRPITRTDKPRSDSVAGSAEEVGGVSTGAPPCEEKIDRNSKGGRETGGTRWHLSGLSGETGHKDAGATRNRSSRSDRSRTPVFLWSGGCADFPELPAHQEGISRVGHRSSGARQVSPPRWSGCVCQNHKKMTLTLSLKPRSRSIVKKLFLFFFIRAQRSASSESLSGCRRAPFLVFLLILRTTDARSTGRIQPSPVPF
jgi:hypothetical protein